MAGFYKCGNCFERLPLTDNPALDYQSFMAHRAACPKLAAAASELERIRSQFADEREDAWHAKERAAAAPVEKKPWIRPELKRLSKRKLKRRIARAPMWWQFWRKA